MVVILIPEFPGLYALSRSNRGRAGGELGAIAIIERPEADCIPLIKDHPAEKARSQDC
ncbi:MAG: hypothetical protein ACFB8W_15675 [Elainellaceae cyanobacterium]